MAELLHFNVLKDYNYNLMDSNEDDRNTLDFLWCGIILIPKELILIEALQLIGKNIIYLRFIGDNKERNTIVRFRDNTIHPLKSMADGIIKILAIILNIFAAEDGYLLIDELDNELHHNVQKSLLKIIFRL